MRRTRGLPGSFFRGKTGNKIGSTRPKSACRPWPGRIVGGGGGRSSPRFHTASGGPLLQPNLMAEKTRSLLAGARFASMGGASSSEGEDKGEPGYTSKRERDSGGLSHFTEQEYFSITPQEYYRRNRGTKRQRETRQRRPRAAGSKRQNRSIDRRPTLRVSRNRVARSTGPLSSALRRPEPRAPERGRGSRPVRRVPLSQALREEGRSLADAAAVFSAATPTDDVEDFEDDDSVQPSGNSPSCHSVDRDSISPSLPNAPVTATGSDTERPVATSAPRAPKPSDPAISAAVSSPPVSKARGSGDEFKFPPPPTSKRKNAKRDSLASTKPSSSKVSPPTARPSAPASSTLVSPGLEQSATNASITPPSKPNLSSPVQNSDLNTTADSDSAADSKSEGTRRSSFSRPFAQPAPAVSTPSTRRGRRVSWLDTLRSTPRSTPQTTPRLKRGSPQSRSAKMARQRRRSKRAHGRLSTRLYKLLDFETSQRNMREHGRRVLNVGGSSQASSSAASDDISLFFVAHIQDVAAFKCTAAALATIVSVSGASVSATAPQEPTQAWVGSTVRLFLPQGLCSRLGFRKGSDVRVEWPWACAIVAGTRTFWNTRFCFEPSDHDRMHAKPDDEPLERANASARGFFGRPEPPAPELKLYHEPEESMGTQSQPSQSGTVVLSLESGKSMIPWPVSHGDPAMTSLMCSSSGLLGFHPDVSCDDHYDA